MRLEGQAGSKTYEYGRVVSWAHDVLRLVRANIRRAKEGPRVLPWHRQMSKGVGAWRLDEQRRSWPSCSVGCSQLFFVSGEETRPLKSAPGPRRRPDHFPHKGRKAATILPEGCGETNLGVAAEGSWADGGSAGPGVTNRHHPSSLGGGDHAAGQRGLPGTQKTGPRRREFATASAK